jgi:predicted permease
MSVIPELAAASRQWRRHPAVPLVVVLSLSVGIGAATGVWSVSDAVLWRPWPLAAPTRVVWVQSVDRAQAGKTSPGVVAAWQTRTRTLAGLAAIRPVEASIRDQVGIDRLPGVQTSAAVFDLLGVPPVAGRSFTAEDERPGVEPVVMLSHRVWRTRYASAPDVLGRLLELDGQPRSVVGVAAPALDGLPFTGDWWTPLAADWTSSATGPRYLDVIGRMGDGVTVGDVATELTDIAASIGAVGDTGVALSARIMPLREAFADRAVRVLYPMAGAIAIVLLMALVNAATFLLAHGSRRRVELAVRAALGATRAALVRQLLLESALLVAAAAAIGLLLSRWTTDGLVAVLPDDLPGLSNARVEGRSVGFLLALSAVLFAGLGIGSVWRDARRPRLDHALGGARGLVSQPERWRAAFVLAQVAIAVTLSAAGLVAVRTSRNLANVPAGYDGSGVLSAILRLPAADFPTSTAVRRTVDALIQGVEARGVGTRAAVATRMPLSGGAPGADLARASEDFAAGTDRQVRIRFITPSYFDVVGTPIVAGRTFTAEDREGAPRVVLVNETLARRLAVERSALGEAVVFGVPDFNPQPRTTWEVVGVVADTRDRGPRADVEPEVYVSLAQGPAGVLDWIGRQLVLVARSASTGALTSATLRAVASTADPRLGVFDVRPLADRLGQHLATERLLVWLLAPLGVLALALTGLGVFALVVHIVNGRRRELALRMVLGATPGQLTTGAMTRGIWLAAGGSALGVVGAVVVDRVLASIAFDARATDLGPLVAVLLVVGLATVLAVWLPTRSAVAQDPGVVLRQE